MGERPKPVSLLVIFYGSHAFLFVLIFILLGVRMQGCSGQPEYTPGGFVILIFLIYIISLIGFLLNLSVAYGIFLAKAWARILGIAISVLGLLFLFQAHLSLVVILITGFPFPLYLLDVSDIILSIAAIYCLTRPEVKAYFKKKRISQREEELSKEEYEKLTKEEKHMKEEYDQLMEED